MNLAGALVIIFLFAWVGNAIVGDALSTFTARRAATVERQTGPAVDAAVQSVTQTIAAQVATGVVDGPYALPQQTSVAAPPCVDAQGSVCGTGYTVDYSTKGGTPGSGSGSGNVTAFNVERATGVYEHRIAVDALVTIVNPDGSSLGSRPYRITVRTIAAKPWVMPVGVQDLASNTTALAIGQADDGGCNGTTGCDPNAVDTEDATTVTGTTLCGNGAGSGTCIPGEERANTAPQDQNWNNGNASQGAYRP